MSNTISFLKYFSNIIRNSVLAYSFTLLAFNLFYNLWRNGGDDVIIADNGSI